MPEPVITEVPLDQKPYQEFKQERAKEAVTAPPTEEAKPAVATEAAQPEEVEETEEKPKHKGGFQKRIDHLTKELRAKEREAELLAEIARLKGEPLAEKKPAVEPVKVGKPKLDDYASYEDFVEALADFKAEEKYQSLKAKDEEKLQTESNEADLRQKFDAHVKRVMVAQEKYPDYDEVIANIDSEQDAIPEGLALTIMELDNGPDVAYHLAKDPELTAKLKGMSVLKAIAELGKLSDKLTAKTEEPRKPKTAAPAPIKPVATGTTKSAVPLAEMSYSEYKKARQQGRTA